MAEYLHPELRNLAEDLNEDELGEIAKQALEDYRNDEESRLEWLSMHADWLRLYFQKDRPINAPWEGSSEESIPMLAEACNQFHARAFQAMFPNQSIIKAVPTGKPDEKSKQRAERVGTHMSWQLMVKDKTYKKNKDRLLLSTPLHGSTFTKTYYCPLRKRNITENVRATDLVVPYGTGPRDLEDIERKTHIIWMPVNKAKKLHKTGFFIDAPEAWENPEQGEKNEADQAHDDVMGLREAAYGDGTYVKILEQHRLWDLDDDEIAEPYIVWVDAASEKVLRVAIRYDTDEAGNPTDDKEPVEQFTHYPFLENPDGFYGLGFGHLIGQLNIAVNKLIRQTVDGGTLAGVGNMSGFVNKGISAKKGEVQLQLGKFITTESSVEDISRGIYQFKFPPPSPALTQIAELLMSRSDRLATVTEALTGQTDKVMQPTTILALIEQSLQVFSTVYERILGSWASELEKHFRLNRKHMDPEEFFGVLDITGALKEASAGREDYTDDLQIRPLADPKMSTERQKLAKSDAEWEFANSNPLIVNSPMHYYQASIRRAEALGIEDPGELVPKPPVELPRVDDPAKENIGALSPEPMMPFVFPDQDHNLHIKVHQDLLDDDVFGMRLGPAGVQELQNHIQAHAAFLYGQTENFDGLDRMEEIARNGVLPEGNEAEIRPQLAGGDDLGVGQEATGPSPGVGSDGGLN